MVCFVVIGRYFFQLYLFIYSSSQIRKLKEAFTKCKDANKQTGNSRHECDFFAEFDSVEGGRDIYSLSYFSEAGKRAEAAEAAAQEEPVSDEENESTSPSMVTPAARAMPATTPAAPNKTVAVRTQRKLGAGKRKKEERAERSLAVMEGMKANGDAMLELLKQFVTSYCASASAAPNAGASVAGASVAPVAGSSKPKTPQGKRKRVSKKPTPCKKLVMNAITSNPSSSDDSADTSPGSDVFD